MKTVIVLLVVKREQEVAMTNGGHILDRLHAVVTARKKGDPEQSYTARLFASGRARIAQKVGEEALETALAAVMMEECREDVVNESADLLYHLMVLWAETSIEPASVWHVLEQRFGSSGLNEKKTRPVSQDLEIENRKENIVYDSDNVFARILRGEIPCKRVYEDEYTLAFCDINPQAPVHVLVIPKGNYSDMNNFSAHASDQEIIALQRAVTNVTQVTGIYESGYRCLYNVGINGGQEVSHVHIHVFGGHYLGTYNLTAASKENS